MKSWKIRGLAALLAVTLMGTTISEGSKVYAYESQGEMAFEETSNNSSDNQSEDSSDLVSESASESSENETENGIDNISESDENESVSVEDASEAVESECIFSEEVSLEETEEVLTIFPEDRYIFGRGGHEVYRPENDDELSLCNVTVTEQEKKELEALFLQKLLAEPSATEIVFPANKYNVYVVM